MQFIMENKGSDDLPANLISVLDGANINPDDLDAVVVLVRALLKASEDDLAALTLASTQANTAYDTATSIHDAAVVKKVELEKEETDLQTSLNAKSAEVAQQVLNVQNALNAQTAAEGAKTNAQVTLETETARLDGEITTLEQVIELLTGLGAKDIAKIDFGNLNQFIQQGFVAIGGPDRSGGTVSGTVGPLTVTVSGHQFIRGAYPAVTSGPEVSISNLLRSSLLCNDDCTMQIVIAGLTVGKKYSIKSYHHDTAAPRGGGPFSLSWNGGTVVQLRQSGSAQAPNPATTYTAEVTAKAPIVGGVVQNYGAATLTIRSTANGVTRAHVDVNGLDIRAPLY